MFIKVIYFFSFLIPKGLFVSKLIMWAYARQHITNIWILFAEVCLLCLFVCFISTNNWLQEKATQRRGVEANGAMALQPVEAPGPLCQQTAKEVVWMLHNIGQSVEDGVAVAD